MKTTDLTKLLLAAAIPGAAAFGVIPVTDNLGIRGYIDGSYKNVDLPAPFKKESLKLDNADVDFLITTDKIKSEIHLSGLDELEIEQAFITFDLGNGLSITGGRFESMLGFEGDEQYKLYQNSYANDFHEGVLSPIINQWTNQNYQQGLKADYKMDSLSLAASVVDSTQGNLDGDAKDLGFELSATYNLMKGLTLGAGLSGGDFNLTESTLEDWEDMLLEWDAYPNFANTPFTADYDSFENEEVHNTDNRYNIWAQYDGIENLILAAEYNSMGGNEDDFSWDLDSWLAMANYSFGNSAAITLRYSETTLKTKDAGVSGKLNADKITVSPSYSFTDNLLGVAEYSKVDWGAANGGAKYDFFAVEGIFTF